MTPNQKKKFAFIAIAIIAGVSIVIDMSSQPNDAKIYDYFPYINGVAFIAAGLYCFLFCFGIRKPKYKTPDQKIRVEEMLKTKGNFLKFCSIVMIIFGAYNLIVHDPNMYRPNRRVQNSKWTTRDKEIFIKGCLRIAEPKLKNHHQIALDYCTCAFDKVVKDMSKKQYIDDLSMSKQAQSAKFDTVFDGCAVNLKRRVDSVEQKKRGSYNLQ